VFIAFDDIRHAAAGFQLVRTREAPTPQIYAGLRMHELKPRQDEFKSHTATTDSTRAALRGADSTLGIP
jgi:hypothetical protein